MFVALDSELNREVALKQILDSHAHDPVSRQRFLARGRGHRRPRASRDRAGLRPGHTRRRPPVLCDAVHSRRHAQRGHRPIPRRRSLKRTPDRRSLELRKLCADSPTFATPSIMPTAAECCTVISSRRTLSSAGMARRWSLTGGLQRRPANPTRLPASERCCRLRPAAARKRYRAARWEPRHT